MKRVVQEGQKRPQIALGGVSQENGVKWKELDAFVELDQWQRSEGGHRGTSRYSMGCNTATAATTTRGHSHNPSEPRAPLMSQKGPVAVCNSSKASHLRSKAIGRKGQMQ